MVIGIQGRPDPPELRGIIPNSFQHIFEHVSNASDVQFLVRASYLEIYNEEIRDLLSKEPKNSLELKENVDSGVYVKVFTIHLLHLYVYTIFETYLIVTF